MSNDRPAARALSVFLASALVLIQPLQALAQAVRAPALVAAPGAAAAGAAAVSFSPAALTAPSVLAPALLAPAAPAATPVPAASAAASAATPVAAASAAASAAAPVAARTAAATSLDAARGLAPAPAALAGPDRSASAETAKAEAGRAFDLFVVRPAASESPVAGAARAAIPALIPAAPRTRVAKAARPLPSATPLRRSRVKSYAPKLLLAAAAGLAAWALHHLGVHPGAAAAPLALLAGALGGPRGATPAQVSDFLALAEQAVPAGGVLTYEEAARIAYRQGLDSAQVQAVLSELMDRGELGMRDNKVIVRYSFAARASQAASPDAAERRGDLAALEAVKKLNSGSPMDHAAGLAAVADALSLYDRSEHENGVRLDQRKEAEVLRGNLALEHLGDLLRLHKAGVEAARPEGDAFRVQRAADVDEALDWLKTAAYARGSVPTMTRELHAKLLKIMADVTPRDEHGGQPDELVNAYIETVELLEKYDPFYFLEPARSAPAAAPGKAFRDAVMAATRPGTPIHEEKAAAAAAAGGLDAERARAELTEMARDGWIALRANGVMIASSLAARLAEAAPGDPARGAHEKALSGVQALNSADAIDHLRAVARLDEAGARYVELYRGKEQPAGLHVEISVLRANAALEAAADALRAASNAIDDSLSGARPAPYDGLDRGALERTRTRIEEALAWADAAYYSADRRTVMPPEVSAALQDLANLRAFREIVKGRIGGDQEIVRGVRLVREFLEANARGGRAVAGLTSFDVTQREGRDPLESASALAAKIGDIGMPDAIKQVVLKEYAKYSEMNPKDSEAQKLRTYLEWLTEMPWGQRTEDSLDIAKARATLDADHSGLEMVKERVLEFLALRKKTGSKKGAIIAFTGPPGVGKTSIAAAIAQALGRKFVRLSLGGVHDESVLRGHGRTYVGSMPGEIMRQMKNAGTVNPVMLLDEADKLGRNGNSGDPTAALLEILDPAQNNTYRDRYLDVPYDLSEVLFVVTSNELSNIPEPLRDRMEIIEFDGYTTIEKMAIAEKHIIPQKLAVAGLTPEEAKLTPAAIRKVIEGYTMEAGVRSLRERIEAIFRKISAWTETKGEKAPGVVDEQDVAKYLGVQRFSARETAQNGIGVATGLAVNAYGGSMLNVEVSVEPGTGQLKLRKQFGDDIEDSAKNALKYVKTHAEKLGLKDFDFTKHDIDINITPAGKVDGPSAGGLMVTAIVSALTKRPVTPGLAMTGEITMRGDILPIGGLKQKVMAAHRMGYKEVIFPYANLKDIESIPQEVRDGIILTPARTYDDIYPRALIP